LNRAKCNWNTWTAGRPAELVHLETGLRLTPMLYSDRTAHATDLPPGNLLRSGRRGLCDGRIEFETHHEETHLEWAYDRNPDDTLALNGAAVHMGNGGLGIGSTSA